MNIRRRATSLLSIGVSPRHVLAYGVFFAIAQVAACGTQVSVGHGAGDSGGMGGSKVMAEHTAQGGAESTMASAGGIAPGDNGPGLGQAAGQAGAATASCTGSLEAVDQALGPACPASLCEANAWAIASCSLSSGVLNAGLQACAPALQAIQLDLGDGMTKTCIYNANRKAAGAPPTAFGAASDGDLVGVGVTDVRDRFCGGTSQSISAGQSMPADCTNVRGSLCKRPDSTGDAGAPNSGVPEEPIVACFDSFSSSCMPCCTATLPDCSDKPNGYPGYRCSVGTGSFCSCACSQGIWQCPC